MTVLAEFTLGSALLTVLTVFVFMAWLLVLFTILNDLFRDHSISGWAKGAWIFFLIFVPFLTALIYLVVRHDGMQERALQMQKDSQKAMALHSGSTADEIEKLAKLRDSGEISAEEFGKMKAKLVG